MGKTERVTVSFEVTRSRQYQTVKFGLSEEILLAEGDDREAVVKSVRARLFKEVNDTAGKALEHVLAQQESPAVTP
jgi:hypothetical protein